MATLSSLSRFWLQISISLACKKAKREMSVREREKNLFSSSVANRERTRLLQKDKKLRAINVREETERKKYPFDESIWEVVYRAYSDLYAQQEYMKVSIKNIQTCLFD